MLQHPVPLELIISLASYSVNNEHTCQGQRRLDQDHIGRELSVPMSQGGLAAR